MTDETSRALGATSLSQLMPMHVGVCVQGRITSLGPTLAKLMGTPLPIGQEFLSIFALRRPTTVTNFDELLACAGRKLQISLSGVPEPFRGIAVKTADGGMVINLSFGIHLIEAVRQHALTDADFAATDLAMEMLYLVEVKTTVMQELRQLNLRLQGAKTAAEQQAATDTLTGLRNRRALDAMLANLVAQGGEFGLMHIDLDYFKQVNDTHGHAAGDHVLRHVAEALTVETRSTDLVARVGGDEFVIVLPNLTRKQRLLRIAERIIARISAPIDFENHECQVSASIGMVLSSSYTAPNVDRMLADADAALYASKHAGRGQASFHDPDEAGRLSA